MATVADDLYSVSFQSQFSIVLSMLHSREEIIIPPVMHNKNNNRVPDCSWYQKQKKRALGTLGTSREDIKFIPR